MRKRRNLKNLKMLRISGASLSICWQATEQCLEANEWPEDFALMSPHIKFLTVADSLNFLVLPGGML